MKLDRARFRRTRRRLALRWKLRRVNRLPKPRRFRIAGGPQDHAPYLSGLQIWMGRWAGKFVLRRDLWDEQLHVQRSQLSDRGAAPGIIRALLRQQRGVVVSVVALLAVALTADELLHYLGHHIETIIPAHRFLGRHLSLPPIGALHDVLVATAAGTGTILGLVVTVSLIVFQATAERYKRPRIVAFLLRERVGRTVVSLLVVSFLYPLALLLLAGLLGPVKPYVGTLFAVLLATAGVVALVGYRVHALTAYLPGRLFQSLSGEVATQIRRTLKTGGRSVPAHARTIVTEDLSTLEDLVARLLADEEYPSLTEGLRALSGPLEAYLGLKRRLPDESYWYPRQAVRLRANPMYGITDHVTAQGLMAPTQSEPDHDWLERRILRVVRLARDGIRTSAHVTDAADLWDAVIELYGRAWQLAWHSEEMAVAQAIFDDAAALASDARVAQQPHCAEKLAQFAWVVMDTAAQGFSTTAEDVVDRKPWEKARTLLPRLAAEQAAALRDKIQLEVALIGAVQTPRDWMIADISPAWSRSEHEHREHVLADVQRLLSTLLASAAATAAGPAVTEMFLRILIRSMERDVLPDLDPSLLQLFDRAFGATTGDDYANLRDTFMIATRSMAEHGKWPQNWLFLTIYELAILTRDRQRQRQPGDTAQQIEAAFDGLFLVAHSYAWAEFLEEPRGFTMVGPLLQMVWPLDGLIALIGDHLASSLLVPFNTSVKYGNWFQPLRTAVSDLPDRYVQDGGIGYSVVKDHPSDLFRDAGLMGVDGDEALEHLVSRLRRARDREIERLVHVLELIRRDRS
jgi:hypothetical protein